MFENTDYSGLTGIVVTPADPEYESARQEYNRAIQKYPLAIVYCLRAGDVRNAVRWCRETGVGLRIRSGGHNYEGYSVGNAVLVCDLSRMDAVRLDRFNHTVEAQGGAKNRQVYAVLAQSGLPFAGGSCPTVGVSGYALGGGWNFFCRYWGLGCDWLTGLRMIDYKGELLTANEECNPDLYWACRGGGDGNFGVVVSMTFRLPPKPGRVTFFTLNRPDATAGAQAGFLSAWQQWLPGLDRRMTLRCGLYNSSAEGRSIFVRGVFFGRPEEAKRLLAPLVESAGLALRTRYTTFENAVALIGSFYPGSEMFQSTGRFVHRMYEEEEIERIVRLLDAPPEGLEQIELALFAMGGRVSATPDTATAFFYRDARYILSMQAAWADPASAGEGDAWVRRAFDTIEPLTAGSFVNFPYDGLADYERAYYGGNVERLRAVKRMYDPEDFFRFPQSIRP